MSGEFAGYIGSNIDITDLKRAEEERERLRQLQADLAHINRLATVGELTASLAHEIKQPIAAAVIHAECVRAMASRESPNVMEACEAASSNGHRRNARPPISSTEFAHSTGEVRQNGS